MSRAQIVVNKLIFKLLCSYWWENQSWEEKKEKEEEMRQCGLIKLLLNPDKEKKTSKTGNHANGPNSQWQHCDRFQFWCKSCEKISLEKHAWMWHWVCYNRAWMWLLLVPKKNVPTALLVLWVPLILTWHVLSSEIATTTLRSSDLFFYSACWMFYIHHCIEVDKMAFSNMCGQLWRVGAFVYSSLDWHDSLSLNRKEQLADC